jgi:hypothetical protein
MRCVEHRSKTQAGNQNREFIAAACRDENISNQMTATWDSSSVNFQMFLLANGFLNL